MFSVVRRHPAVLSYDAARTGTEAAWHAKSISDKTRRASEIGINHEFGLFDNYINSQQEVRTTQSRVTPLCDVASRDQEACAKKIIPHGRMHGNLPPALSEVAGLIKRTKADSTAHNDSWTDSIRNPGWRKLRSGTSLTCVCKKKKTVDICCLFSPSQIRDQDRMVTQKRRRGTRLP